MTLTTERQGMSFADDIGRSRVIEEAQAAWKAWSARQKCSAPTHPLDGELVQLRVWIERGADKAEWQAHVEQVIGG